MGKGFHSSSSKNRTEIITQWVLVCPNNPLPTPPLQTIKHPYAAAMTE